MTTMEILLLSPSSRLHVEEFNCAPKGAKSLPQLVFPVLTLLLGPDMWKDCSLVQPEPYALGVHQEAAPPWLQDRRGEGAAPEKCHDS